MKKYLVSDEDNDDNQKFSDYKEAIESAKVRAAESPGSKIIIYKASEYYLARVVPEKYDAAKP